MSRLLTAGLFRVFKRKTFYICLAVMAINGIFNVISSYSDKMRGHIINFDDVFFEYVPIIQILMSVFCALFIGTEYGDGTLRNKIVSGYKRSTIYLSNFIICAAAGLMMCGAYFITYFGLGIPLLGSSDNISALMALVGCSAALLMAVTGIFTLIAMTVKSKSASAVISIILAFVMILAAGMLYSMLQEPEYYHNFKIYSYSGNDIYNEQTLDNDPENQIEADAKDYEPGFHMSFSDGKETAANDIESSELVPNKFYISGIKRQIYQFIVEFTPGGQALLIVSRDVGNPLLLVGYSMIIAAVTTAAGIIIFNKMNLN